MKLIWTPESIDNLEAIFSYIAKENPKAASASIARINKAAKLLVEFPLSGRSGKRKNTRELTIPGNNYFLSYRIKTNSIDILSIIHQSRDWH